ncbi:hypothetical protein G6F48_006664 [Rhizopus delemar]|nr:hypothetical protein G6F48_006664 [Rhizopus delemar]
MFIIDSVIILQSNHPPDKLPNVGKIPVNGLFERFGIDYIGPFPESRPGNKYIIIDVEYFTNWPAAKAVSKASSDTTIKFLYEEIFCNFGLVMKILSDNGARFFSKEVNDFAKYVSAKHQFSAPYSPTTNGKVEHINRIITRGIKKIVMNNKRNWDTMLPSILYTYRTKVHKTLNISPYEALFGLAPRNINDDSLYKLGMRLGLERLYFLMDKQVNQEEKVFKENEPPIKSLSKIEIGDQVIMMKHLKKDKLDDTYKKKIYTVVDKFHRNTFIW